MRALCLLVLATPTVVHAKDEPWVERIRAAQYANQALTRHGQAKFTRCFLTRR
jgi:hypothetical protein